MSNWLLCVCVCVCASFFFFSSLFLSHFLTNWLQRRAGFWCFFFFLIFSGYYHFCKAFLYLRTNSSWFLFSNVGFESGFNPVKCLSIKTWGSFSLSFCFVFSVNDKPEDQHISIDNCSSVFIYVDFPRLKWHIYKKTTTIFTFSKIYHHNLREYSDFLSRIFSGYKVETFASAFM